MIWRELSPAKIILDPLDIILAKIGSGLCLDEDQRCVARRILNAVRIAAGDIDGGTAFD